MADERCATPASEGGGSAPFLLVDLDRDGGQSAEKIARLAVALKGVSTERLLNGLRSIFTRARDIERNGALAFDGGLPDLDYDGALLIGAELTRRGMPPIFRRLPYFCDAEASAPFWHDTDSDLLALMLDAEWLVNRHPVSRYAWEAGRKLHDPKRFRSTCLWLHWNGRRSPAQIAVALGLMPDVQAELAYVQYLAIAREKRRMWGLLPVAEARIRADAESRGHDRRSAEAKAITLQRRIAIWLCGQLAKGKPQRTTDLLEMLTGERLARGVVARHLEKLPVMRRPYE